MLQQKVKKRRLLAVVDEETRQPLRGLGPADSADRQTFFERNKIERILYCELETIEDLTTERFDATKLLQEELFGTE